MKKRWHIAGLCSACAFGALVAEDVLAQALPSAFTTGFRYVRNLKAGQISPDPDGAGALRFPATRYSYDDARRLIKVEQGELANWQPETVQPANWVGFTIFATTDIAYDAFNNKTRETVSSGGTAYRVVQYSYDLNDRVQCTTVRMDTSVYGSLPTDACTSSTPVGAAVPDRITRNLYDIAGELIQIRSAAGTAAEQATATYSYTADGLTDYTIDANGNRARFIYDGFDRRVQWQFPSTTRPTAFNPATPQTALATAGAVNTADYEAYSFDAGDNLTNLRKRDGQNIGSSYNALNWRDSKTSPSGNVSYSYDLQGHQLTALFTSTGQGITNVYDGFGRKTSSTINLGGTARALSYQYDADNNRTLITYPDANAVQFDFDGVDRLTNLRPSGGAATVTIVYNAAGRRSAITRTSGANTAYGYDGIGRLTSLTHNLAGTTNDYSATLTYNPAHQVIQRTVGTNVYAYTGAVNGSAAYVSNGLNQYSSVASITYGYDLNGNLTSDGSTTYTYDAENRLTAASGAKTATITYDPLGRIYQTGGGTAGTTTFLFDGDALVARYTAAGALLRRYAFGPDPDEPLIWFEGADLSAPRYFHSDYQSSVVAVSTTTAAAQTINTYDPYGEPGSANVGQFQFTGQLRIPEAGVYHYKARAYSSSLGRFLQVDPVGYNDDINLYAYTSNDPISKFDPTGRDGKYIYSKTTGQIEIRIPVYYSGSAATPETVAAIQHRVESLTLPDPKYRIDVVVLSGPGGKGTNQLDLSPGADKKNYELAGEGINKLGGNNGHINSSNADFVSAAAHDTLHFVGIDDKYKEGPKNPDGTRGPSITLPGWTDSNIMASRAGTELTQPQLDEAKKGPTTIRCTIKGNITATSCEE